MWFKKFCAIIAAIFFVSFCSTASADALKPIYDYSVNTLLDNMKNVAAKDNISIWGVRNYTDDKGNPCVDAHFGESDKNLLTFRLKKNGAVASMSITGDFSGTTKSSQKSVHEFARKVAESVCVLLSFFSNVVLNDRDQKKLESQYSTGLDDVLKWSHVEKLKDGITPNNPKGIGLSGVEVNKRYYRIFWNLNFDTEEITIGVLAFAV